MPTTTIFDFNNTINTIDWVIVDDVVMGGRSSGNFSINARGNGVFHGDVSLENNGGFSSLRYRFKTLKTEEFEHIVLRVKGDGKRYQFRLKNQIGDPQSYVNYFSTNGKWQIIKLPLHEFYPTFRGRLLNMPYYQNKL